MKVLLINPPIREHAPPVHFPTGLAYIAKVLLNNNIKVEILDINAHRYNKEQVINKLENLNYDAVGIGGIITTYKYTKWLVQEIRKTKNTKIILGGSLASSAPELILNKIKPDIITIGEGEITAKHLFTALKENTPLKDIKGIWYLEDNEIKKNPPNELIKDLDTLPTPAYHLFPVEKYIHYATHESGFRNRMNMISSRGCPFDCGFCYKLFGGRSYRMRSAENIIEEIKYLKKQFNIKNISFADDNFTVNPERLKKFCELLKKEKLDITWSCLGRVDSINKEMLKTIKKAGCNYMGFGIESASQKILNNMSKRTNVETAKKAIKLTRKAGIAVNCTFILGYIGEDEQTIRETIDFCKELHIDGTSFFILTPYPGTPAYKEALKMGRIKDIENFVEECGDATKVLVNLTDWTDEQLTNKKKEILKELHISVPKKFYYRLRSVKFQNFFFWVAAVLNLTSRYPRDERYKKK